jgi:hypothetical protein
MSALAQRLRTNTDDDALAVLHNLYIKAANSRAGWYIGDSEIAGQGIFASRDYEPGDVLGVAMTSGGEDEFGAKIWNLTEMARYCNHQTAANAKLVRDGDVYKLIASKPIGNDEEVVADYTQVTRAAGPHSRMLWDGKPIPTSDLSDFKERDGN